MVLQAPRDQQRQQKFVPANQSGKQKKNKSRCYKKKPQKPNASHGYEGHDPQTISTGQASMGQE